LTPRRRNEIVEIFTEVVIAPDATEDAKADFRGKEEPSPPDDRRPCPPRRSTAAMTYRQVSGGILVQDKDVGRIVRSRKAEAP
jgi:phosphoribosylaminoimidazolecarboxamide formyltransferase/IMP cyclohydrolase